MSDITRKVIDNLEKISAIPRCSKKEAKIARWIADWAAGRRFPARRAVGCRHRDTVEPAQRRYDPSGGNNGAHSRGSGFGRCRRHRRKQLPGREPSLDSALLHRCKAVYRNRFGRNPVVQTIYAGLECGLIGSRKPGLDMISFGPTIDNPHSPDEKLFVPSVTRVWDFMVHLLASYSA